MSLLRPEKSLHVSVIETKGCHDEVTASFFSALGQIKDCQVEGYLAAQRWGIDDIYTQLPGIQQRVMKDKKELLKAIDSFTPDGNAESNEGTLLEHYAPDIIISVTGEYDLVDKKSQKLWTYLLENTEAVIFAVVHHPNEWDNHHFTAAKPWITARRFRLITLSDHVTQHFNSNFMEKWSQMVDTSYLHLSTFPPIFTIPTLATSAGSLITSVSSDGQTTMEEANKIRFALQGDLIVPRNPNRDYKGTFKRFAELLNETEDRSSLELRVVGNGGLPLVPEDAKDNIKFSVELPYPDFYSILHSATAILPAFASEDYLTRKASSTIPAAYIAEVPLIANDKLLKAYKYVDKENVYYMEQGEDEMDVVARISKLSKGERMKKSADLKMKNQLLVKKSSDLLERWMRESLDERTF